jgi:pyruvate dehydrogenase E1 component
MEKAVSSTLGPAPEDRFWYITLYNENYLMPPLPSGDEGERIRSGILRGLYRFAGPAELAGAPAAAHAASGAGGNGGRHATLLFSGPMWQAAMEARRILAADWGVSADAWSVTSYCELRHDALSVERANRLHPTDAPRVPFVTESLLAGNGPVVAVSDYLRAVPDQVARFIPRPFTSLGTDGFGRSDTRAALRRFFEVDAAHIVVAVLAALAQQGEAKPEEVADAMAAYGIDPAAVDPWAV